MTVLFLSQIVPYPPHGGVLQRGFNLIRELGRHAEVHLLAFVHPDVLPTPQTLDESRQVLQQFCRTVEYFPLWPKANAISKVAALGAGLFSQDPFSVVAHRSGAFKRRVGEIIRERRVDVLHVDTVALSQFVPPGLTIPAVLTHHNIESLLMERRAQVETRMLARWYLQREVQKLRRYEADRSRTFDINITMSVPDEAILKQLVAGVRTAVVPNGVDVDYFAPDETPETPSLIYTGGMNMFANRDAVLYFLEHVWPRITAAAPDVRFLAVGQDPPKELQAIAARDRRVTVTGYVTDIRPLVRQAAVYVVPLRVGGGTRLKVLDAMASGKALVSTTIGCEGIDVTPGTHLLVADTPEQFARATVDLLGAPETRRRLGDAARARVVERYSWSVVGQQLLRAYERAADRVGRVA